MCIDPRMSDLAKQQDNLALFDGRARCEIALCSHLFRALDIATTASVTSFETDIQSVYTKSPAVGPLQPKDLLKKHLRICSEDEGKKYVDVMTYEEVSRISFMQRCVHHCLGCLLI